MDAETTRPAQPRMAAFVALARRPSLWAEGVRAAAAFAPRRWWRRPPFLPLPDATHMRWRIATAYGSAGAPLRADDLVEFLRWRRRQRSR